MVMQVGLPDGTKRKGFQDLKEAANLEITKGDVRPERRGAIEREIKKLRSIKK
jgi:hypothetical protein